MTNGDYVRSMTNNQLSDKLGCECCTYIDRNTGRCKAEYEQSPCREGILKWLNKTHRRKNNEIMAER